MEAILRTAMQSLDKDVVVKAYEEFIASQVAKDTTTDVIKGTTKKKAVKKETEEKKEKRIPRMTATLLKQLESELTKANAEVNFDNKKETEKVKKNFVSYIDDLTEDDFGAKNIAQHMRDFANLHTTKENEHAEVEDNTVYKLTLKQLQTIEKISESDKLEKGVYWDADNGRKVTGPERDQDEDLEEKTFKKIKYIVGETTGRVYLDNDDQEFVGYIGVNKFKEMI